MINKPASEKMRIIHDTKRPMITDYINELFTDFTELYGDRYFSDDHAILGGVGYFNGTPVTVIGHRKGRTIEQNMDANFGMAHPEGYRKALRLAHQAEKFHRPVINFVDTGGAFCGVGAEERGQGEAIARCLYEFIERVLMLENALYSVISPRGCASILWKDPKREAEAADTLHITAQDLYSFGMIEGIIQEGTSSAQLIRNVARTLRDQLAELDAEPDIDTMLQKRYEKFRRVGVFRTINQESNEGV